MKRILSATVLLPLLLSAAEFRSNAYFDAAPAPTFAMYAGFDHGWFGCAATPYYFPPACHRLAAMSALGDTLEIEDGSVWKIQSYDSYEVFQWHPNDPLVLTQNTDWFSTYRYRLINKTNNSSAAINLFMGPLLNSQNSRFIASINHNQGELTLTDSSRWIISPRDLYLFREWISNDCIIVGLNSGWDAGYECILINSNMDNFIRAKQF
jgi:hypothetical protein